jgi:hypothetical protein
MSAKKSKSKQTAKETTAKQLTTEKKPKATRETHPTKLSALDAAAKVLAEFKEPMNARQMIDAMAAKGYWTSPGGPQAEPWQFHAPHCLHPASVGIMLTPLIDGGPYPPRLHAGHRGAVT